MEVTFPEMSHCPALQVADLEDALLIVLQVVAACHWNRVDAGVVGTASDVGKFKLSPLADDECGAPNPKPRR